MVGYLIGPADWVGIASEGRAVLGLGTAPSDPKSEQLETYLPFFLVFFAACFAASIARPSFAMPFDTYC